MRGTRPVDLTFELQSIENEGPPWPAESFVRRGCDDVCERKRVAKAFCGNQSARV